MSSTQRVIDLYYRSTVSVPAHCPSAPRKSRSFAIKTQYSVADWQITRSILQGADEITALALFTYTHGALCCITSFFYADRAFSPLYERHIFFVFVHVRKTNSNTSIFNLPLFRQKDIYIESSQSMKVFKRYFTEDLYRYIVKHFEISLAL